MIKHAYMIMAHDQFELLSILIKMLDDPRNDIFLHIDKKAKDFKAEELKQSVKYSKIIFTERISVTWGDFSVVKAEMLLLKKAVENENAQVRYSYFHLLSGSDLPLKTNDEIHDFFSRNNGKEFIHFSESGKALAAISRIRYYHLFRSKRNLVCKILAQAVLKIQKALKINRLKGSNIKISKGSEWFSITGEFAHYLVENMTELQKMFRFSYCADEVFIQTAVLNSTFCNHLFMPNCNDDQFAAARYIDWTRGAPYVFRSSDFNDLISSPAMFARKFSLHVDKDIVYRLSCFIEGKNNEIKL